MKQNVCNVNVSSSTALLDAVDQAYDATKGKEKTFNGIRSALKNEEQALAVLIKIKNEIEIQGLKNTLEKLKQQSEDYSLPLRYWKRTPPNLNF